MKKVTLTSKNSNPRLLNNEGFQIDQELIHLSCRKMESMNASVLKMNYYNCGTLNGKDFYMVMIDRSKLTFLQKFIVYLYNKVL